MYWKRKQNATYILVYQQQFRLMVTAYVGFEKQQIQGEVMELIRRLFMP